IEDKPSMVISMHHKIYKYIAVAGIAVVLFTTGILTSDLFITDSDKVVLNTQIPEESALFVSMVNGQAKKIVAEDYNIEFEGIIRLYSKSTSNQVVVCNGKKITLIPNRPYFIKNSASKGFVEYDRGF